jgi:DNA-binding response OmpR family regulator
MAKARILIVDDETDVVRSVGLRLKSAGYEVLAAIDGLTGTQVACEQQPDLIILDIGMPCADGHTVAKRLSINLKTMSIPIIYLTARTAADDVDRALKGGAAGYLTKPFKAEALLGLIERVLSGSAPVAPRPAGAV